MKMEAISLLERQNRFGAEKARADALKESTMARWIHLSRACRERIQLYRHPAGLPVLPLPSSNERDFGNHFLFDQSALGQMVLGHLSQCLG